MDSIIFIVVVFYASILAVLAGYCLYRRFREVIGDSLFECRDDGLFVLRNYFDADLVPKMPRIAVVECLTILGVFLSLAMVSEVDIFTVGAMTFAWMLILSLGVAFLSVRAVVFLSQFLVDICFVLFMTVIAAVLLIGWRRMRLWK